MSIMHDLAIVRSQGFCMRVRSVRPSIHARNGDCGVMAEVTVRKPRVSTCQVVTKLALMEWEEVSEEEIEKSIGSPAKIPKTFSGWYILGCKVLEYICEQVHCGHEPSATACPQCLVFLLHSNITFAHDMHWTLLIEYVLNFRKTYKHIIESARRRLTERGLLVKMSSWFTSFESSQETYWILLCFLCLWFSHYCCDRRSLERESISARDTSLSKKVSSVSKRKEEMTPEEFLKLRSEPAKVYFECLCGRKIYIPTKPSAKTIRCYQCKSVWKLHTDFVSGTGDKKGWQIPFLKNDT